MRKRKGGKIRHYPYDTLSLLILRWLAQHATLPLLFYLSLSFSITLSLTHICPPQRIFSCCLSCTLSLSASAFLWSSIVCLSSPHVSSYSACLSVALHRFKSLSPCLYCCGGITNLDPCHTVWITDNQPIVFLYTTAAPATPPFTLSFFFWAGGPKTSLKRILGHSAEIKVVVTHPAPI